MDFDLDSKMVVGAPWDGLTSHVFHHLVGATLVYILGEYFCTDQYHPLPTPISIQPESFWIFHDSRPDKRQFPGLQVAIKPSSAGVHI